MASSDETSTLASVASLPEQHQDTFTRAIANVLSSSVAEVTFGQIIDGLPLSDVALDTYEGYLCAFHPLVDTRLELSPGVLEQARSLRQTFDPTTLKMSAELLHAYCIAAPASRAFKTRLVEMVATAVHQMAVWLHNQDHCIPPDDPLRLWRPSPEDLKSLYNNKYPPVLFLHEWYQDYERYPNGVADCVGFWAEARIFGGVVLFDRRDPESAASVDPSAIYLHADRREVMYRIFKMTDSQRHSLIQFLLADATPPPSCPLPILGSKSNRERVDPEEPLEATGIYRNLWERNTPVYTLNGDRRLKDVIDTFNYLSDDDFFAAGFRARRAG